MRKQESRPTAETQSGLTNFKFRLEHLVHFTHLVQFTHVNGFGP